MESDKPSIHMDLAVEALSCSEFLTFLGYCCFEEYRPLTFVFCKRSFADRLWFGCCIHSKTLHQEGMLSGFLTNEVAT